MFGEMALAPKGDRIAWLLYSASKERAGKFLIKLATSFSDATRMRVVGTIDTSHPEYHWGEICNLDWTPDSRRIVFYVPLQLRDFTILAD